MDGLMRGGDEAYIVSLCRIAAARHNLSVLFSDTEETFSIRRIQSGAGNDSNASWVVVISRKAMRTDDPETFNAILYGAIVHECVGHGRHTDMTLAIERTPLLHSIVNVLEDIRIERLAWDDFPGARMALENMAVALEDPLRTKNPFWVVDEYSTPESKLLVALVRKMRAEMLMQPLDADRTQDACALLEAILGKATYDKIMDLAFQGGASGSTAEVVGFSRKILDELHRHNKSQPQQGQGQGQGQGQPGQPQQGQQGQGQQGQGQGQGQPGQPQQGQQGQGQQGQGGAAFDDQATGNGASGSVPGSRPQSDPSDPANRPFQEFSDGIDIDATIEAAMRKALKAIAHPTHSGGLLIPFDDIFDARSRNPKGGKSRGHADGARSETPYPVMVRNAHVVRMRNAIQKTIIAAGVDPDETPAKHGQAVDTRNLAMIAAGLETRPFLYDDGEHMPGIDAELIFNFDASGSMESVGEEFMRELIMGLGNACMPFVPRLQFSMYQFAGNAMHLFDSRRQSWHKERSRVAGGYIAHGGTVWLSGSIDLMARLACSKRKRKMLVTFSDGCLESGEDIDRAIASFKKHNVDVSIISFDHALQSRHLILADKTPQSIAEAIQASISRTFRRKAS